MPRQAVRLVLGRSPKAPSTTRLRPFSTTPGRRDDDASKPTARRDRSVAAASAIGAMSRPSQPSQRTQGSSRAPQRSTVGSRNPANVPHTAALGSRLGANVISMRSLPKKTYGDGGKNFFRRVDPGRDGDGRSPASQRPQQGPGGAGGEGGRFAGGRFTPGPNGPRFVRPQGQQQRGQPASRLRATLGGPKRPPMKRAGGMKKKSRSDDDKKKERDEASKSGLDTLDKEVQDYVRLQHVGGPLRHYTPSVTLESLVGWGPAVATNTALGQAEMAFRSVKVLGGGRGAGEEEQSFKIDDVKKWLVANKPIYFSNVEQKRAVIETLSHEKRDKLVQRYMDNIVKEIQHKNGNNWGGFVESFKAWAVKLASSEEGKQLGESIDRSNPRPEDWLKAVAEARADARLQEMATNYKTQNTKNTREAIQKHVLKGEHPEVKYAEDVYGKLAAYHAKGSTYTNTDGAKFDERARKLIKVPAAGQAAPRAQSTA